MQSDWTLTFKFRGLVVLNGKFLTAVSPLNHRETLLSRWILLPSFCLIAECACTQYLSKAQSGVVHDRASEVGICANV